ncbi:clp ATPase, partial [Yersinia pestis PY-01]
MKEAKNEYHSPDS